MSAFQDWAEGDEAPWGTVNENNDALGQPWTFAQRKAGHSGLNVGIGGGPYTEAITISDQTVACTDDDDTYIVANRSTGALSAAITTTNWNDTATYGRVAIVAFASGVLTSFRDFRFGDGGIFRTDTSGAVSSVNGQTGSVSLNGGYIGVKGSDIASASTVDLAAATGDWVDVTGTTAITAFGTLAAGIVRVVRFTGALTLTHNATSLILPGGANITTAAGDVAVLRSLGAGNWVCAAYQRASGLPVLSQVQCIPIACSDESTALTTGTAKVTFHMPFAFNLTGISAGVTTAPTGADIIVDVNESGTSIMTTNKLRIDAGEESTHTAATPPALTDTALAAGAKITIDVDQIGSTIAGAGLKVYLLGRPA